ncbi:MAG: hypothetical protein ACWGPN_16630 [Gammaproteobacteria bacterium]
MLRWLGATLLVLACGFHPGSAALAQQESLPRTANGTPDLSGVWQSVNAANWNLEPHAASAGATEMLGAIAAVVPGLGVVDSGTIPYLPEAREQRERNFANRRTEDPEAKCFRPGIPRATYLPQPFQIIQTPTEIFMAYQYAKASRSIHMTNHGPAPVDGWMGWSNGRWEGDTLVVEVTGMNANWLDRAGNFFSENVRVVERYTPIDASHLQYEATIEDPTVFERPWSISMPLYRRIEPDAQLLEFKCVEFAEELMYGHLSKSAAQSEGSSGNE